MLNMKPHRFDRRPGLSVGGRRKATQNGFTLLELIIVIAVIGILAAIALPRLMDVPLKAREAALKTNLRTMRDALDQHFADKGAYPASLVELAEAGYLRDVPKDPITGENDTWIEIFEEPDLEAEFDAGFGDGEEAAAGVVDIASGSEELARDGTPYSEW